MGKNEGREDNNLCSFYDHSKYQKCFIGHTYNVSWRSVIIEVCDEVLPEFGLRPWYADAQFATTSLHEKAVEMIENTHYGIYDLSYWRVDDQHQWQMPQNVFIELGMAIALNRPVLLLRHTENRITGLTLPDCLQSVESSVCEFTGGKKSLRDTLRTHLPDWIKRSPEQEWHNRYCRFGSMICTYRDAHPLSLHALQDKIFCHIADGHDADRDDFRASVEEIIERFDTIGYHYLDTYSLPHGYNFSLCSQCQLVRSTPFAIYRLTTQTPAEVLITIGMSIVLDKQFGYKIPKIVLTDSLEHIPSLLTGYQVVVVRNDRELRARLAQILPQVTQRVQETAWKPRTLPFEVHLPSKDTYSSEQNEEAEENGPLPGDSQKGEKKVIKIFYSYAHQDEKLQKQLDMHLNVLKRKYDVVSWHYRDITAGMEWRQEIDAHLNSANIILLLVSPDFLDSDYCYGVEMKHALKRHAAGGTHVIPIILRSTDWKNTPLGPLYALPTDAKPVSEWKNRDEAFMSIVKRIEDVIKEILSED